MADGRGPLGILGGTFDPVHFGHLRLGEEARALLGLEQVLWVPAGRPPHRPAPGTPPQQRLELVKLAIAGNPGFALDDAEALSELPSYTVDTLRRLRAEHGEARPLVLILGADAFLGLATWHLWKSLFELAHVAVATRPSYALEPTLMADELADEYRRRLRREARALAQAPAGRIVPFAITPLDISATTIRAAFSKHGSARYLLPDPVLDYIDRSGLYR